MTNGAACPGSGTETLKMRKAMKTGHINKGILEEVGFALALKPALSGARHPDSNCLWQQSNYPNKDASKRVGSLCLGAPAPALPLCGFSQLCLPLSLGWQHDDTVVLGAKSRRDKTPKKNRTFSFSASFLGARRKFPEFHPAEVSL